MKDLITVESTTVEIIKKQLLERGTPNSSLRLGIKGGGCSGYTYVIQYDDDLPSNNDIVINFDFFKILIDKKSYQYLVGSKLIWKTSLMFTGFYIENPQETSKCGCGHSFEIK